MTKWPGEDISNYITIERGQKSLDFFFLSTVTTVLANTPLQCSTAPMVVHYNHQLTKGAVCLVGLSYHPVKQKKQHYGEADILCPQNGCATEARKRSTEDL